MTAAAAREAGTPQVSLVALGVAAFLVTGSAHTITPLLRVISAEFDTNIGRTALIVSAYALPYGACQLLYGPLGDRLGKLRVMTLAVLAFAIATAACAAAPNLPLLAVCRAITGGAAAAVIPLSLAYIGDTVPYSQRQAALGRFLLATSLGQVFGASLGGIFGEFLSWRTIFLLVAVAAGAVWTALRRTAQQVPVTPSTTGAATGLAAYHLIWRRPAARLVIAGVWVEGFFAFTGLGYLGAFLRDRYSLPYLGIGFMLAGFGLGGVIYSRTVRRLVRRFGEPGLLLFGGAINCVCYLAIAFSGVWALFVPLNIVLGFGFGLLHGTLQTKATELAPTARGAAVSLFAFSLFLGQGLGAALLGALIDNAGYTAALALVGIATGLLALGLVALPQLGPRN